MKNCDRRGELFRKLGVQDVAGISYDEGHRAAIAVIDR